MWDEGGIRVKVDEDGVGVKDDEDGVGVKSEEKKRENKVTYP